jgi:NAD(P)H-dependent FMN reductase
MSKVVAIVGSYRRGGITDTAVDAILEGARTAGAETSKIYLVERDIRFCLNCRRCTQEEGAERGKCFQQDDLEGVLKEIESADGVVLSSPVNYFNVTAIFRRFMERLLGYTYWPWGVKMGPVLRANRATKRAVLVTSASMPAVLIPIATGATRALKVTARMLGAKPVGRLWIGLVGVQPEEALRAKIRAKAERLGLKLVRA